MKYILPFIFITACSTVSQKPSMNPEKVRNEDFKKEKPLTNSQVTDFYKSVSKSLSPALQDETVDRYHKSELSEIKPAGDPLLDISIMCSKGDFSDAFRLASDQFNRYQKTAAYWNQIANCHLNAGSHRKALLFYNKALEVEPNYIPSLNNIGVMYSRQGQDQKALVAFERANKLSKFSKTPRYNLARIYLTYGLAEAALPIFQSLLSASPQDAGLLNAVGSAHFMLSDYQKALSYFKNIPQNEWTRPEVGLNLALTLQKTGKQTEAKKVFDLIDTPKDGHLKKYYTTVKAHLGGSK